MDIIIDKIVKKPFKRTPVSKRAKQFAKLLKEDCPNYSYLRELFRQIRIDLDIKVTHKEQKLPYVPSEEEMRKYYEMVWKSRDMNHVVIIKTLLYTGVRVSELVNIKLSEVDLDKCQIKITQGRGKKDRIVPFPNSFKEILAIHISKMKDKNSKYLFESSWKKNYTDRAIRKISAHYTKLAGIQESISPNKLRQFLFTWLKKQGINDELIQPYSGNESLKSLEVYSKLSLNDVQKEYDNNMDKFPI
jgi:integrase/recombinase XerD